MYIYSKDHLQSSSPPSLSPPVYLLSLMAIRSTWCWRSATEEKKRFFSQYASSCREIKQYVLELKFPSSLKPPHKSFVYPWAWKQRVDLRLDHDMSIIPSVHLLVVFQQQQLQRHIHMRRQVLDLLLSLLVHSLLPQSAGLPRLLLTFTCSSSRKAQLINDYFNKRIKIIETATWASSSKRGGKKEKQIRHQKKGRTRFQADAI